MDTGPSFINTSPPTLIILIIAEKQIITNSGFTNRVKMDTDFNTSLQGLHCLGDSSGWTRGLMMASVMGVLMGRKIAEEG